MAEKVFFHYADRKLTIPHKRIIKDCLIRLFKEEGKLLERLDYIFCSDEYLLQINKEFLQHDYYTDIISFDLSDSKSIKGEIYISVDRVKENALTHSSSFRKESVRVIGHGALHLCGYKDKSQKDIKTMRKKEEAFIISFLSSVPRETN